jgi:cell wall assembly regulator SMI1
MSRRSSLLQFFPDEHALETRPSTALATERKNAMKNPMERLEKWLEVNLPEVYADLAQGCPEAAVSEFESLVGRAFPQSLKDLYSAHDGQKGEADTGPFYGLMFLPLADAKRHWARWNSMVDQSSAEEMKTAGALSKSATPGAIKEVHANKYWIPFAYDAAGNHLGVDLDPGESGTFGQVINFGRDENEKFVVGSSLATFLDWMADQLDSGNSNIHDEDDGGRSFNMKTPKTFHFLDAVPELFASQRGT